MNRSIFPAAGLALLAACAPTAVREAPEVRPTAPTFSTRGLEAVMGQSARSLETRFGQADLDIREGTARKLQFSGPACVLDAYLYPRGRGEPVVTWIDARRPGGEDIDRASCVAALERAR